jgi:hypothetical protein
MTVWTVWRRSKWEEGWRERRGEAAPFLPKHSRRTRTLLSSPAFTDKEPEAERPVTGSRLLSTT